MKKKEIIICNHKLFRWICKYNNKGKCTHHLQCEKYHITIPPIIKEETISEITNKRDIAFNNYMKKKDIEQLGMSEAYNDILDILNMKYYKNNQRR